MSLFRILLVPIENIVTVLDQFQAYTVSESLISFDILTIYSADFFFFLIN